MKHVSIQNFPSDNQSTTSIRNRIEVVIRKNNKVLVAQYKRKNNNYFYTLPGGGLEDMEDIYQAAKREVLEEVGISIKNIIPLNVVLHFNPFSYSYKYDSIYTQWMAADFSHNDFSLMNKSTDSATGIKWVSTEEAKELVLGSYYAKGSVKALEQVEWLLDGGRNVL